jgi:hypothetical protein
MPSKKRRTPGADDEQPGLVPYTVRTRPPGKTPPPKSSIWHHQESAFIPHRKFQSKRSMDVEWAIDPISWLDLRVYKSFQRKCFNNRKKTFRLQPTS